MKRSVSIDEWWPCYSLNEPDEWAEEPEIEVPDELVARWEKCIKEFNELEKILRELVRPEKRR